MDAQANLLLPKVMTKNSIFKLKLSVHNMTYLNIGNSACKCIFFDETTADLSSSTFVTTTVNYIHEQVHIFRNEQQEHGIVNVVIRSDTCAAQNRNRFLTNALLHLCRELNIVVTQTFCISGHSQMELDNIHALIEKQIKNVEIYSVEKYLQLTQNARKGLQIETQLCPPSYFREFKTHQIMKTIKPKHANVQHIIAIQVEPNGKVSCMTKYGESYEQLRESKNINFVPLGDRITYDKIIPISKAKYDDLMSMINIINPESRDFYVNLPHVSKISIDQIRLVQKR